MLKWGMASFKGASDITGMIDKQLALLEGKPPEPPKPDPAEQKAQMEMQKMQQEGQQKQAEGQMKMSVEQQHAQLEQQKAQAELQFKPSRRPSCASRGWRWNSSSSRRSWR